MSAQAALVAVHVGAVFPPKRQSRPKAALRVSVSGASSSWFGLHWRRQCRLDLRCSFQRWNLSLRRRHSCRPRPWFQFDRPGSHRHRSCHCWRHPLARLPCRQLRCRNLAIRSLASWNLTLNFCISDSARRRGNAEPCLDLSSTSRFTLRDQVYAEGPGPGPHDRGFLLAASPNRYQQA